MKKFLPILGAAMFLFAGTMSTPSPKPITVEGTLVDTKCYGMASAMGKPEMAIHNDHMVMKDGKMMNVPNCATACASMGIPTGVTTADGKTYIIITSATALKEHMAKEVRVTGDEAFKGGILAKKVEVKEGDKWKDVTPGAMM